MTSTFTSTFELNAQFLESLATNLYEAALKVYPPDHPVGGTARSRMAAFYQGQASGRLRSIARDLREMDRSARDRQGAL